MNHNKAKINNYSDEELKELLTSSKSLREFINKIGYSIGGSAIYKFVRFKLEERNLTKYIPKYDYNDRFKKLLTGEQNKPILNSAKLKRWIIKNNLIKYTCADCGNSGTWNNKKLVLQLEHKNGNNKDGRIENLCFLCPNCHSQTETFCGRHRRKCQNCNNKATKYSKYCEKCTTEKRIKGRKIERPTLDSILKDVIEFGFRGTGKKYGVSDNAIRKWIKVYEREKCE